MLTGKKQQQRLIFRRESNGLTGLEPNDCIRLKSEALYSSKETLTLHHNKQSSLMTAAKKHLENSSISSEATKWTDRKKKRKGHLNMKLSC